MIIEKIEPIVLRIPFSGSPGVDGPARDLNLVFCRITTQSGLQGFGECLCVGPAMQQALAATLRDAIAPVYQGQSVVDREALNFDVRRRFASFGRSGLVINALGAVDIALWDIAGKAAGRSLSTMLGGARRTSIPVMASLDRYGHGGRVRGRVEQALGAGVAAVKVHEADLTVIEAARNAVDASIPFVADLNNAHALADIHRDLDRWQALDLLWLEDPVWPPEDLLDQPALVRVPVGLGADLGSADQLELYGRATSVNVIQPDVCMVGGITETLKVFAAVKDLHVAIAPHTPFIGPAALASLHLIASMEEPAFFAAVEAEESMDFYGIGLHRWQRSVTVPVGPGLGFDPDPALLRRYALV